MAPTEPGFYWVRQWHMGDEAEPGWRWAEAEVHTLYPHAAGSPLYVRGMDLATVVHIAWGPRIHEPPEPVAERYPLRCKRIDWEGVEDGGFALDSDGPLRCRKAMGFEALTHWVFNRLIDSINELNS